MLYFAVLIGIAVTPTIRRLVELLFPPRDTDRLDVENSVEASSDTSSRQEEVITWTIAESSLRVTDVFNTREPDAYFDASMEEAPSQPLLSKLYSVLGLSVNTGQEDAHVPAAVVNPPEPEAVCCSGAVGNVSSQSLLSNLYTVLGFSNDAASEDTHVPAATVNPPEPEEACDPGAVGDVSSRSLLSNLYSTLGFSNNAAADNAPEPEEAWIVASGNSTPEPEEARASAAVEDVPSQSLLSNIYNVLSFRDDAALEDHDVPADLDKAPESKEACDAEAVEDVAPQPLLSTLYNALGLSDNEVQEEAHGPADMDNTCEPAEARVPSGEDNVCDPGAEDDGPSQPLMSTLFSALGFSDNEVQEDSKVPAAVDNDPEPEESCVDSADGDVSSQLLLTSLYGALGFSDNAYVEDPHDPSAQDNDPEPEEASESVDNTAELQEAAEEDVPSQPLLTTFYGALGFGENVAPEENDPEPEETSVPVVVDNILEPENICAPADVENASSLWSHLYNVMVFSDNEEELEEETHVPAVVDNTLEPEGVCVPEAVEDVPSRSLWSTFYSVLGVSDNTEDANDSSSEEEDAWFDALEMEEVPAREDVFSQSLWSKLYNHWGFRYNEGIEDTLDSPELEEIWFDACMGTLEEEETHLDAPQPLGLNIYSSLYNIWQGGSDDAAPEDTHV
ncbi:hypothetical protein JOB18_048060 [Solea senegalensis]|uniref:Uncharacterized protein n=1 Tax=Solea senegalensis TaxID=28829 RepID=A0AAV6SMT5_SOLSE|nr:hypothetical protein JOB18_048060 [Solea senegalensis]